MALPGWKKLERSRFVVRTKLRLRQFLGVELTETADIPRDVVIDGDWAYDPTLLDVSSVVYSLGVGDTIEFDVRLIERTGASVHAFDPTPNAEVTLAANTLPPEFHFYAAAAAGSDGELTLYPRVRSNGSLSTTMFTSTPEPRNAHLGQTVPALTVSSMAEKLGHSHIDLLKMDIEGAEYEVLDDLIANGPLPRQLLVEFHHRHKGIGRNRTERSLRLLRDEGYRAFYVAENMREFSFLLSQIDD